MGTLMSASRFPLVRRAWLAAALFVAPVAAQTTKLSVSHALRPTGTVDAFIVSPDGTRVAYVALQNGDSKHELFVVPTDSSASSLQLSAPVPLSGVVQTDVRFTPDGARLVYRANQADLTS